MWEEVVTPTIKTHVLERSIISGYSQVILFCKKWALTFLRICRSLLHMLHKIKHVVPAKPSWERREKETKFCRDTVGQKLLMFGPSVDEGEY